MHAEILQMACSRLAGIMEFAMPRRTLVPLIRRDALFIWILLAAPAAWTAEPNPEGIELFEKTIRPLLAANCLSCHNAAKHKGGLVLENEAGLKKGGDTGPAVKPGDPDKSLLVE